MPYIDRNPYKAARNAARPRYDLEQVKAWLASRTAEADGKGVEA